MSKRKCVYISPDHHKAASLTAALLQIPIGDVVEAALESYLRKNRKVKDIVRDFLPR